MQTLKHHGQTRMHAEFSNPSEFFLQGNLTRLISTKTQVHSLLSNWETMFAYCNDRNNNVFRIKA